MTAKHTPGPWHWDSDPVKGDPLGRVRYQVTALGRTITKTYYSGEEGSVAEADTRLLAAAPDLLEALQEMWDSSCTNAASRPSKAAFLKARAAIAKATGEPQS